MPQGTSDNKTSVTVTNVGSTSPTADEFRMNLHRGHKITRVGTFSDGKAARPYEVWYCQDDHALVVS